MSDKEWTLRNRQLKNQAAHQETFQVFSMKGPVTFELKEGAEFAANAPTQPFKEVSIPDGAKYQTQLAGTAMAAATAGILGYKAIDNANGSSSMSNSHNVTTPGAVPGN